MRATSILTFNGDIYIYINETNEKIECRKRTNIFLTFSFHPWTLQVNLCRKAGMRSHSSKSWRSIPKYRKRKPLTLKYNMYEGLFVMEMLSITSPNCKAELRKRLSTEAELLSFHVRKDGGKCIYNTREVVLYQVVLNFPLKISLLDYMVSLIKPILYFVLFTG